MNLQEAFEKGKSEYEKYNTMAIGRVSVKEPGDLKNIENESVKKLHFSHEFSGELPCLEDYPNLEELSISSDFQISDLQDQDLSKIKSLSVFSDYSETKISFQTDELKRLDLHICNNQYRDQIGLFDKPFPIIDLHNLNNLETLVLYDVKGCQIIWPEQSNSVKKLVVVYGEFLDYTFIDNFPNVEDLSLVSCNISDCSFVQRLNNLSVLDLASNNIETIPKPVCHLSFLNLKWNKIIEDSNIYSFADEVIITERDYQLHSFKNWINSFIYSSYRQVLYHRKPNPKRPEIMQRIIDSKTDEELFLRNLTDEINHYIARILDPDDYRNRIAKLTFEELKAIANEILPFVEITHYRIEKIKGSYRYIKEE
jgi:hypothetical protein